MMVGLQPKRINTRDFRNTPAVSDDYAFFWSSKCICVLTISKTFRFLASVHCLSLFSSASLFLHASFPHFFLLFSLHSAMLFLWVQRLFCFVDELRFILWVNIKFNMMCIKLTFALFFLLHVRLWRDHLTLRFLCISNPRRWLLRSVSGSRTNFHVSTLRKNVVFQAEIKIIIKSNTSIY